jgi:aspartyl-tRNA synthetase
LPKSKSFRSEWVVRIDGKVRHRPEGTVNADLPTGKIEIYVSAVEVLGTCRRAAAAGSRANRNILRT